MRTPNHIFVYGTLRGAEAAAVAHLAPGDPRRMLARCARPIGEALFRGRLYDLGPYPAVVDSDHPSDRVRGEVHELVDRDRDRALRQLDSYEGCGPGCPEPTEYVRAVRPVRLTATGSICRAWVYLYNRSPAGLRRIDSGDYARPDA